MRYAKYIAAFVAMILSTACAMPDFDEGGINSNKKGDSSITIAGRLTHFNDHDVATRATSKQDGEEELNTMALALFDIEDGAIGECIYYDYRGHGELTFTIERDKSIPVDYDNKPIAMYIFANIPSLEKYTEDDSWKNVTLAELLAEAHSIDGVALPEIGLPMVGSKGDYISTFENDGIDGDGYEFILKPTTGTADTADYEIELPTENGVATDFINIPLASLMARISFTISLEPDQELDNTLGASPSFEIEDYKVYNVPSTVTSNETLNSDGAAPKRVLLEGGYQRDVVGGSTDNGAISFHFYLPERLLTPATSAEDYAYPLGDNGANVNGYSNLREEDKRYAQRFKGYLVDETQKATYITISGIFKDHQNHRYNVEYTIHLGGDEYGDFNIKRNTHYKNSVVLRGISATNDSGLDKGDVAFDHRVSASRTLPLVINLRRETLLDAHFEVRPLYLRLNEKNFDELPTDATATISVVDMGDGTDWIGLEVSGEGRTTHDDGNPVQYCTDGDDKGKRKYFTTTLMDELPESVTVSGLTSAYKKVWIYVDENTNYGQKTTRKAKISVQFSASTGETYSPIEYVITQYDLHQIVGDNGTYYIECYEEYLYDYDAMGNYGETEDAGMEWGLYNAQLSFTNGAIDLSGSSDNGWTSSIRNIIQSYLPVQPKYDFYISSHDTDITGDVTKYSNAGYEFNSKIIQAINTSSYNEDNGNENTNDTGYNGYINVLGLDEQPQSAIEYCHNKNKRNTDGTVISGTNTDNMVWYLPATDEIEDFIVPAYGAYDEFQNNFYWSCQPSYTRNMIHASSWTTPTVVGAYYTDDRGIEYIDGEDLYSGNAISNAVTNTYHNGRARATKVELRQEIDSDGKIIYTPYNTPSGVQATNIINGSTINVYENAITASGFLGSSRAYVTNGLCQGAWINSLDDPTSQYYDIIKRDEGNRFRDQKSRVRCVRKMN